MEMRPVRAGTHEAEVVLSEPEVPLKIHIVFPFDLAKKVDFSLSWRFLGYKASECKKLLEVIDGIRSGRTIKFTDLRLDKPIFESSADSAFEDDPFDLNLRKTILLASQIEQKFSIILKMPAAVSEEDTEALIHFDCLLNGREYGKAAGTTLKLSKQEGEAGALQVDFIKGETAAVVIEEPLNYPGYFSLFGQRINTPSWIRATEFAVLKKDTDVKAFEEALPGTQFEIKIVPKGATLLRWKDSYNVKVPLLTSPSSAVKTAVEDESQD